MVTFHNFLFLFIHGGVYSANVSRYGVPIYKQHILIGFVLIEIERSASRLVFFVRIEASKRCAVCGGQLYNC